jgi:CheY-like chemotaxis protein
MIVCTNNPTLVATLSRAFAGGPRITVTETGLQVLAAVDVVHADLLVIDLETPGINPLLLTSAIRALAPALPILAVSPLPSAAGRDLSHRGVSFLPLPADQGAWAQALRTALDELGCGGALDQVSLPTGARTH